MSNPRPESVTTGLARLGFDDPRRALALLDDAALHSVIDNRESIETDGLARALADTADPDQALLGVVRLMESVCRVATSPERARLEEVLRSDDDPRRRLGGLQCPH